jgi:hypothetical protein
MGAAALMTRDPRARTARVGVGFFWGIFFCMAGLGDCSKGNARYVMVSAALLGEFGHV